MLKEETLVELEVIAEEAGKRLIDVMEDRQAESYVDNMLTEIEKLEAIKPKSPKSEHYVKVMIADYKAQIREIKQRLKPDTLENFFEDAKRQAFIYYLDLHREYHEIEYRFHAEKKQLLDKSVSDIQAESIARKMSGFSKDKFLKKLTAYERRVLTPIFDSKTFDEDIEQLVSKQLKHAKNDFYELLEYEIGNVRNVDVELQPDGSLKGMVVGKKFRGIKIDLNPPEIGGCFSITTKFERIQ